MSTTGRTDDDAPRASDVAASLREGTFVRLVAAPRGDALAAAGVLGRALAARDCPFQASVVSTTGDRTRATDADCTVVLGSADTTADATLPGTARPVSETAAAVVREFGGEAPVALALAGVLADGRFADSPVVDAAREAGVERRPGVAVPTADPADGLAHSTLVHAPFSGDRDATAGALDDLDLPGTLDDGDRRRVASLVALRTAGHADAPPRTATAVERALRPFEGGPFGTVGGYADVLDAVARERPGTGIALALGHDVHEGALDAWRAHARRAHAAVRGATTGRYDGLFVARLDPPAPVGTTARLLHDFRSPEPTTLTVSEGKAALLTETGDPGRIIREAAAAVDGAGAVGGRTGHVRFDDDAALVAAVREVKGR